MTTTRTESRPPVSGDGQRAARTSLLFLWWVPISILVGFAVAGRFLDESWPMWQVIPLAGVLALPFGIGSYQGIKAVRLGERRGWIGFVLNLMLVVVALVMPISEALS